jgi:hypothetical protein
MKIILLMFTSCICITLFAQNKVGINTLTPATTLDVNGDATFRNKILLNGDAGQNKQFLMSSGAGADPVWSSVAVSGGGRFHILPANNSRSTGGFQGRGTWNLSSGTSQDDSLDYGSVSETGSDFTISNSGLINNFITVNRTGLYHFEGAIRYFVTSETSITLFSRATLDFVANQPSLADLNLLLDETRLEQTGGTATGNSTNNYNLTLKFSLNIQLQANSTCTFITGFNLLRLTVGTPLIAMGVSQGGYVSGYFVAE